ncbi:MAG: hypothetical protein PUD66_00640 [Oscillospiraceae bacterium]|nr:hypothetical protein [Oscillospiraceae bacterium]
MNEQIPNAAERFADEHQQEQRELLVGSVRYRVSCRAAETHPSQQRGQQGNPLRSFHRVFPPFVPSCFVQYGTNRADWELSTPLQDAEHARCTVDF